MKRLKFIITFFIFITTGCNLPPSGEPHSGPSGIWSDSAYMLGTWTGGARMYFTEPKSLESFGPGAYTSKTNRYIASIHGPNWPDQKCESRGSYTYNTETYIITIHSPDFTSGSCIGVDDPSPTGDWMYKGDYIISPSGAKYYYEKK